MVGVSGGIDSAVTSTLCAQTGYPVICMDMPIHQQKSQLTRAQSHIDWLEDHFNNVSSRHIDLTKVFDDFVDTLDFNASNEENEIPKVNARSRLRMMTLYYIAQANQFIVVGTGNKVEDFGVGFFTKYGDGGVDISPIADLMKTEVFELGKYLGVSDEILSAPPTDGLWNDDRTDEDQIGATYEELEWAMKYNGSPRDLTQRENEVLEIYSKLHKVNKHKMVPIPICKVPEELK